eukprot:scaffold229077_cov21-Tisochrysis_lutea.AAC.1
MEREREKQQLQRAQAELQRVEAEQSHTGELSQDLQPLNNDICQREGNIHSADQQIQHWEQQLAKFAGEGRRYLQQLHSVHTRARMHANIHIHAHAQVVLKCRRLGPLWKAMEWLPCCPRERDALILWPLLCA